MLSGAPFSRALSGNERQTQGEETCDATAPAVSSVSIRRANDGSARSHLKRSAGLLALPGAGRRPMDRARPARHVGGAPVNGANGSERLPIFDSFLRNFPRYIALSSLHLTI